VRHALAATIGLWVRVTDGAWQQYALGLPPLAAITGEPSPPRVKEDMTPELMLLASSSSPPSADPSAEAKSAAHASAREKNLLIYETVPFLG
jgi:hypothetical protein